MVAADPAAAFAAATGLREARTGLTADAFTLAAYDALYVATLAYAEAGLESIEEYRSELLDQAEAYTGATGPTALNATGDRAVGDSDFYQVCGGTPASWARVAAYRAAPATSRA